MGIAQSFNSNSFKEWRVNRVGVLVMVQGSFLSAPVSESLGMAQFLRHVGGMIALQILAVCVAQSRPPVNPRKVLESCSRTSRGWCEGGLELA